jgi:hypothetical protein
MRTKSTACDLDILFRVIDNLLADHPTAKLGIVAHQSG